MIDYLINNKTYQIPQSFTDFNEKHWRFFFSCIEKQKYSSLDIKLRFLKKFTNIPFNKIEKLRKTKNVENSEEYFNHISKIQILLDNLSFFETKIKFEQCPFNFLKPRFSLFKLYPPNNSLSNMKVWEMAIAIDQIKQYEHTKDIKHLNQFVGSIFRKSIPFWKVLRKFNIKSFDRRVKFDDSLIDVYENNAKKIPVFLKKLAIAWFSFSYSSFVSHNKELFSSNEKGSSNDDDFTWADMILTAENSAPGDEDKIANSYAWLFMRRMVLQKRAYEKIKANSKSK